MIPGAWAGLLLALAAFRLVRLAGWDDLPPIYRLRARATGERIRYNATESRDPIFSYDRPLLAHFLQCGYCSGFWISVVVYAAWRFEPRWTLYVAAPLALSAAVGLIARNLDG